MNLREPYSLNQLRDYSSLFSRSSVLEWMKGDFSSIYYKIERYDKRWFSNKKKCYLDYLKHVYGILEGHYQNEYILKNSFLNEWLITELGESDSKLFSEFRVGNAVADLTMFNGLSKVFEIKTELDSDKRLNTQLAYYRRVFNQIYLIIPISKIKLYDSYDSNIGIITFDNEGKQKFELYRKATTQSEVDSKTIMGILHTEEYKAIVQDCYGYLPKMTSFDQYNICKQLIEKIPRDELNNYFIQQMKKRGSLNSMSNRYYKEFNQLSLALKMNKQNRQLLIDRLKTPLNIE